MPTSVDVAHQYSTQQEQGGRDGGHPKVNEAAIADQMRPREHARPPLRRRPPGQRESRDAPHGQRTLPRELWSRVFTRSFMCCFSYRAHSQSSSRASREVIMAGALDDRANEQGDL